MYSLHAVYAPSGFYLDLIVRLNASANMKGVKGACKNKNQFG